LKLKQNKKKRNISWNLFISLSEKYKIWIEKRGMFVEFSTEYISYEDVNAGVLKTD
jgi:hypothetical protein